MPLGSSLVIISYYLIAFSYIFFLFNRYKVCPELIWCVGQLLMFVGITNLVDTSKESDRELLLVYLIGLITFVFFSMLFSSLKRPQKVISYQHNERLDENRKIYLWVIMIVSIVACSYFFIKSGGNVFIKGVQALFFGSDYSVKYGRMSILAASGVGYIYQIRVIVFPLCVLYFFLLHKKSVISYFLAAIMLLFLIGTGQRSGLVSFVAICILSIYYLSNSRKLVNETNIKPKKRFITYAIVISVAITLFALSTLMNGRVASNGTIIDSIVQRFIGDNQSSAVIGFRYIKNEPIQYGKDWAMSLLDILPGKNTSYTPLATKIFALAYGGSTAGTAPECVWGSSYYNFGYVGIIIHGIVCAGLTSRIHYRFTRWPCDEINIVLYAGESFLMGYWVISGPISLFNNGFIATLILDFIMNYMAKRIRVVSPKREPCL